MAIVSDFNKFIAKRSQWRTKFWNHYILSLSLTLSSLFFPFCAKSHTCTRKVKEDMKVTHIKHTQIFTFLSIKSSHLVKSHIITDSNTNFTHISIKDCQFFPSSQCLRFFETNATWDVNIKQMNLQQYANNTLYLFYILYTVCTINCLI